MSDCSDAEMVKSIVGGDSEAFTLLVSRFHRTVYSIAYRMVGNVAEAEDLCQEIFLKVYKNIGQYDQSLPFTPWLRRVACNHTLNSLKRKGLSTSSLEQVDAGSKALSSSNNPEVQMVAESQKKNLQEAIMSLPENYRMAVTLKYVEDMTAEEIAEIMQVPKNTVKTWLFRAREELRDKLDRF
ncbi:MAG: sigma-70 family RNA polymerase sigma factor [Blastocatellia bacterium]|nr:sigma-70 family RNA polymerase sigma factor [Blastocatellia bacterium]